ncbi:protein maelstrom homolog [Chironomus tepperi]|uniref:protein maelstrom homolog n=1 Tax=Chironomus tepperi TaxID=113505 RepID=UPI00391FAE3D
MNNLPRVQKKTKNNKLNGFSLHAIELAGRKVRDYEDTFVTAKDIERAKPSWDRMSTEKRESYKERARRYNVKVTSHQVRYNSLGQSVTEVDNQKNQIEEERNRRRNEIEQLLRDAADLRELDTKVFYFMSASHFYEDCNVILPAEIAFAKFSLKEGIMDTLHVEINPGELPIGSAYKAQSLADSTHRYPLPPECFGESNYLKILSKIMEFLPEDEELPIFFTEGIDDMQSESKIHKDNRRALKYVFEAAQEYDVASDMKIYSILELFHFLQEITTKLRNEQDPDSYCKPFRNLTAAHTAFKQTEAEFLYKSESCVYHEGNDSISFCCLNKCIRFGYIISKWCAAGFKYKLKPGCHFPKNHLSM